MRMTRRPWKVLVLLAAIVSWFTSSANAGLLPVSATVLPEGDNFRYTYGVVLTSDSVLKPGDFFTIYDFDGLVPGSNSQPEGWTFTTSMTGGNPPGTVPTDDPAYPNLTWTYNGPPMEGQIGLGNFWVESENGESTTSSSFTGTTHRQVDDRVDSNITETTVPLVDPGNQIPEPASLVLLAAGLPVAFAARRKNRKEVKA
jgi:hypothetical protein